MNVFQLYSNEEKVLGDLENVLLREKEVLIKGRWKELNEIVEEKNNIIKILATLEKERLEMNEEELLKKLPTEIKEKSIYIKRNIKKLIIGIRESKETNRILAKSSLDYTRYMLNHLGVSNKVQTYGSNGKLGGTSKKINISINQSV